MIPDSNNPLGLFDSESAEQTLNWNDDVADLMRGVIGRYEALISEVQSQLSELHGWTPAHSAEPALPSRSARVPPPAGNAGNVDAGMRVGDALAGPAALGAGQHVGVARLMTAAAVAGEETGGRICGLGRGRPYKSRAESGSNSGSSPVLCASFVPKTACF